MNKSIIPFSTFIGGLARDYNLTLNEALLSEMRFFLGNIFPNGIPMEALTSTHPTFPKYCVAFLGAYGCRESDLEHYTQIMKK